MTVFAATSVATAITVKSNVLVQIPIATLHRVYFATFRAPPEILSIMRVNALRFVVFDVEERTELRFVFKHVKICVVHIVVQEVDLNIFFTMSVAATFTVFAFGNFIRIRNAESFFVLRSVIQNLEVVMAELARISFGAFFFLVKPSIVTELTNIPEV